MLLDLLNERMYDKNKIAIINSFNEIEINKTKTSELK